MPTNQKVSVTAPVANPWLTRAAALREGHRREPARRSPGSDRANASTVVQPLVKCVVRLRCLAAVFKLIERHARADSHPDRDAQFAYLNESVRAALGSRDRS